MFRLPKFSAALVALALGVFSISAQADFTREMDDAGVKAEITKMLGETNPSTGKAYTLVEIGFAFRAVFGADASGIFTADAIGRGSLPADSVTAALIVWGAGSAKEVVTAANAAAPGQSAAIQTAALSIPGVDPAVVLAASGAGTPGGGGAVVPGTPAPAFSGVGGGGGGGVASPA